MIHLEDFGHRNPHNLHTLLLKLSQRIFSQLSDRFAEISPQLINYPQSNRLGSRSFRRQGAGDDRVQQHYVFDRASDWARRIACWGNRCDAVNWIAPNRWSKTNTSIHGARLSNRSTCIGTQSCWD
ncbi:hypothetical protein D3C78_1340950 [compost metagenome]